MKITLMHPPLDDPTLPYHSTAYLKGHLSANGFDDVSMRDINIEFVNFCLEEGNVNAFYEEGERRYRALRDKPRLDYRQQEEFFSFWSANPIPAGEIGRAAASFRNLETFLDWPAYIQNVNTLIRYFNFLGFLGHPSEFSGFKQMGRARYSIYNLRDVFDWELTQSLCWLFRRFFHERLENDPELRRTDCFGISVVYDHQLFHALCFARLLKTRWPEKLVLLGGTSIGQFYKHLRDKSQMKRFFGLCDAIVVGEGETAICEIADVGLELTDLGKREYIPNTIRYNHSTGEAVLPPRIHYENVGKLGRPLYEHPWELYLAPEKGINYAPTRGCYWNRCTFCDYGLNSNRPTSPWRERKIETVIEDLQAACRTEQIKYVYFAVDVMAPGYLERLSDAILDSDLDIRWSAELRMEKIFSLSRCRKMAQGGCVCVSFGMESGNQRILDLIDKGTRTDHMAATMKNFAHSGVAVQLMAFTDFPTETEQEKAETFQFIRDNDEYWAMGGMGTFLLTGTSIIAKNPARFGIEVFETQDTDINRALAYRIRKEDGGHKLVLAEDSDDSFNETRGAFPPVLGRPWASGTDTLHSMIYYNRYGRSFFRRHPIDAQLGQDDCDPMPQAASCTVEIPGKLNASQFDISRFFENRHAYKGYVQQMLQKPAEPTYTSYLDWLSSQPPLERQDEAGFWVTNGNKCLKLDKLVYRILTLSSERQSPLGEVMASLPPSLQERLWAFFGRLEEQDFIVLKDPLNPNRRRRHLFMPDAKAVSKYQRALPEGRLAAE